MSENNDSEIKRFASLFSRINRLNCFFLVYNCLVSTQAAAQKLDADEAAFQANLRKETISRAQQLLADESDAMKRIKSKILLADVMEVGDTTRHRHANLD